MSKENDLLLSLLFDEQSKRELRNIKFFEGVGRPDGATLRAAAFAVLAESLNSGGRRDTPPEITRIPRIVEDFLAEI